MSFIPFVAFFVLIAAGLWLGELGAIGSLVLVAIWIAALTLCILLGLPGAVFTVVGVVLDIVLILMIFGGDIRLS